MSSQLSASAALSCRLPRGGRGRLLVLAGTVIIERRGYRIQMPSRVLGVDACKAGWVGVVLHDTGATVHAAKTIAALVADAEVDGHLAVIGIDIPIGLPDTGRRPADVLAYRLVGPRRSSVS